jgi:lysophospholipase L1-like esterase
MIVRTSIGGRRIRVQFSNAFGTAPLELGAAHVALHGQGAGIVEGTDRSLTFSGASSTTIPVGAVTLSDPVDLVVAPLKELAVSVFVPKEVTLPSWHLLALQTTYISGEGDFTGAATFSESRTRLASYWLSEIDVAAPEHAAAVVTLGDSITDGDNSTPGANRSWPSLLAERLIANRSTENVGVANMGISGNRVLTDGAGINVLARFDRDVLSVAGVRWVVITEGINDIGGIARGTPVTAEALIGALKQMIARAHTHDVKVIGGTLTPFEGANAFTEAGEAIRVSMNAFIRTSKDLDGFVDFEAATRDAGNPRVFRLGFNNGDHLHPNDAGYRAMADAVNLSLFKN